MRNILVTGAFGQIGSELVPALQQRYGAKHIVVSDIRMVPLHSHVATERNYENVDCTQPQQILEAVRRHDIDTIYHLAALLSAVAEEGRIWPGASTWAASTMCWRLPASAAAGFSFPARSGPSVHRRRASIRPR